MFTHDHDDDDDDDDEAAVAAGGGDDGDDGDGSGCGGSDIWPDLIWSDTWWRDAQHLVIIVVVGIVVFPLVVLEDCFWPGTSLCSSTIQCVRPKSLLPAGRQVSWKSVSKGIDQEWITELWSQKVARLCKVP